MTVGRLWCAALAISIATLVATIGAASAQMAGNSVQVAGRIATFLQPGLSGQVTAAIIYQPGDATSEGEARTIERSLGAGLVVGSLRLNSKRVAIGSLSDLGGAKVAFVTKGINYREVAQATASRSILSIGTDPACTQAGYCVVTITSAPKVQITVSKAAARAAHLRFNSGFLMLIREI
jgi:hypothetical protein